MKIVTPPRYKKRNSSKQLSQGKIRKIRLERKVKHPLDEKYENILVKGAKEGRQKRVIQIMLETGMHPAVMAKPELHEMEIDKGRLLWRRPKTFALCIWEFEREGFPREILDEFVAKDLGFSRKTYWSDVVNAADRVGLKYISLLTLRHTGVIRRFMRGEKPEQVQQVFRMSTGVLWGHYAKFMGIEINREKEV